MEGTSNTNSQQANGILFGNVPFELDVLHYLEDDLDIEEKISLVFLLYDDIPVAQEKLFLLNRALSESNGSQVINTDLLREWALSEGSNWKEKIVEALLIIKGYSNLNKLLLNIEDLTNHFLPHTIQTSLFINPIRKVLFNICEALRPDDVNIVIDFIRNDCKEKNIHVIESYNKNIYLKSFELYLLELLRYEYIKMNMWSLNGNKTSSQEIDMSNFIEILNKLNYKTQGELLEYSQTLLNKKELNQETADSPKHSLPKINNISPHKTNNTSHLPCSKESIYTVYNPDNVGFIFIINQMQFKNVRNRELEDKFKYREGSTKDVSRLINTWKSFGFQPVVKNNLKAEDIIFELKYMLMSMVEINHSAFVLCILSHGEEGSIISSDCLKVNIEDIEELFNVTEAPKLAGKPKILLIQSCQGNSRLPALKPLVVKKSTIVRDGVPSNIVEETLPNKSDMLKFYSTIAKYESFRDMDSGTWFIQTLCDHMDEIPYNERKNFFKICVDVTRDVSKKRHEGCAQLPVYQSTFTKDFFIKKVKKQ